MTPYNKIREIGRGGFGIVDEVASVDGLRYARKTLAYPISADLSLKDQLKARFAREVKYQSTVDHPNVVSIIDKDLSDDPPWFIMPLANSSLNSELRSDRTLGQDPGKALFDVLAGVEEIHRLGYKHRDLSPANILRFSNLNSGKSHYAISDFGLMSPELGATTSLTDTNAGGGTLPYRAPECATDFKRATARADIYSIGAILHDIFGHSARIPHAELNAPGQIGDVIGKCTKRNALRRFKDIQELREALYEVLHSPNITFQSDEEAHVCNLLRNNDNLSDDQWDEVFAFADRQSLNQKSTRPLFTSFKRAHVEGVLKSSPDIFHALGIEYAGFAESHAFDFDFCDVIAGIAGIFYDHGEIDLKAIIALSMLKLGTSHNRWYVERAFVNMAGPSISDELAKRMITEADVKGTDIAKQIDHLKFSINVTNDHLHPLLTS